jgi:hypothetical protein
VCVLGNLGQTCETQPTFFLSRNIFLLFFLLLSIDSVDHIHASLKKDMLVVAVAIGFGKGTLIVFHIDMCQDAVNLCAVAPSLLHVRHATMQ